MSKKLTKSQTELLTSFTQEQLLDVIYALIEQNSDAQQLLLNNYLMTPEDKLKSIEKEYKKQLRKKGNYDYWKSHTFFEELEKVVAQPIDQVAKSLPEQTIRLTTQYVKDFDQILQKYDTSSGSWQDYLEALFSAWIKALGVVFSKNSDFDIATVYFNMKAQCDYFPYDFLKRYQTHLPRAAIQILRDKTIELGDHKQATELSFVLKDLSYLNRIYEEKLLSDSENCLQYAVLLFEDYQIEKTIAVIEQLLTENPEYQVLSKARHLLIDALHEQGNTQRALELCKQYFSHLLNVDFYNKFIKLAAKASQAELDEFHQIAKKRGATEYLNFVAGIAAWDLFDQTVRDHLEAANQQANQENKAAWFESLEQSHYTSKIRSWSTSLAKLGFPVSAVFIRRRLVESNLKLANSKYYKYAASDLKKSIDFMDTVNEDLGDLIPSTTEFMATLTAQHQRKYAFWRECQDVISSDLLPSL